jgi:hypothetical protein
MIESVIKTKVTPEKVWEAWIKSYGQNIAAGIEGKSRFSYRILEAIPNKSFSILWKSLFANLIFNHSVKALEKGSEISYRVQVRGLLAVPVQFLLRKKIRRNLDCVLESFVKELENG